MSEACIQHMMKQSGGAIDRATAEAAVADLQAKKQELLAHGEAQIGLTLQRLAGEQALDELATAQAARIRTKRNLISLRQTDAAIQSQESAGISPFEAILNIVEGTTKGVEGGRQGIGQRREGYKARFNGRWLGKIQQERPELAVRLGRDAQFKDEVAHEIMLEGQAGKSEEAQYVAKVISDLFEEMRTELNMRGANINKLSGYIPHRHNAGRMLKRGFAEWAAWINPRLEQPLPDDVLEDVFTKITTGVETLDNVLEKGQAPQNMASKIKRFGQQRTLKFKDPESWLEYNREFGDGHIIQAVTSYIEQTSVVLSVQDVLGTRPRDGLERLRASAAQRIADSDQTPEEKAEAVAALNKSRIDMAVNIALREHLGLPRDHRARKLAEINQTIRTIESTSKLGGAVANAVFGDTATTIFNAQYHGMPILGAATRAMREVLGGMPRKQRREIAFYLGAGYDGLIGHVASRYDTNDGMRGLNAKANELYHKATFLTQVTDGMRASAARMHSAWLGKHSGLEHGKLPKRTKHILSTHGIGEKEWNVARLALEEHQGEKYLMPHKIQDLTDSAIDGLIDVKAKARAKKLAKAAGLEYQSWLDHQRQRKRAELETTLAAYMTDETSFNVIQGDDYSARFTTLGQKEEGLNLAWRLIMQFKTHPIAYTQRVLGRARHGNEAAKLTWGSAGQIAMTLSTLTLAGAAAYTAKELARGNTPPDFTKWENGVTAITMGGGLGIFGDFFFAQENRYGRGFFETLSGPAIGDLSKAGDAFAKARGGEFEKTGAGLARLGLDNIPGKNIWYLRAALENLVLDDLYTRLNPRHEANKARWRRERGQTSWWEEMR